MGVSPYVVVLASERDPGSAPGDTGLTPGDTSAEERALELLGNLGSCVSSATC